MPVTRNQSDVPAHALYSTVRDLVLFPIRFVANGANITSQHLPPDMSIVRTAVGQYSLRFPRAPGRGAWFLLTDSAGAVYVPKTGSATVQVQVTNGLLEIQRGTTAADPAAPVTVSGFLAVKGSAFS